MTLLSHLHNAYSESDSYPSLLRGITAGERAFCYRCALAERKG